MKFKYTPVQLDHMFSCPWMTDRERQIMELYYRRGWAIEDVAAELYISASTVKRALHSIRYKSNN